MKAIVIGAGRMGKAIALDLKSSGLHVVLTDQNVDAGRKLAAEVGVEFKVSDAAKPDTLKVAFQDADVAVSAVPYFLNYPLAKLAVASGVHFCDLGGNEGVVQKELGLDAAAKRAKVCVTPDCGLAPGLVSFLVAWGLTRFNHATSVRVRVGGLPQKPTGPLKYQMIFSMHGLINEYSGYATMLRDGRLARAKTMTGVEKMTFPGVGELEAFHTSGGSSTMPYSYKGKVGDLDYKTIRFPGHCEQMSALMEKYDRKTLAEHLESTLPKTGPDQVLVVIDIEGDRRGRKHRWTLRMRDKEDKKTGLTAMMRTTGFPAAIVAQLMASGRTKRKGALLQEVDFDPAEFVKELKKRKIPFTVDEG